MSTPAIPPCGAQQPGSQTSPFKWPVLGEVATAVTILGVIIKFAPKILTLLGWATQTVALFDGAAAGALSIVAVVFYYAFQADGCIIPVTNGQQICVSGIVQDTSDEGSTAIDVLAAFAMGPAGQFDLVVKTRYLGYVSNASTRWVYCNNAGAPMLRCIIKSKTACGAKIGSLVGVVVGAAAGAIIGYIVGSVALSAAVFCAASVIFYLFCLLLALIIAAIVGAAIAYAGAAVGAAAGEGIADAANSDPVGAAFKSLQAGAIVTVKGTWTTDSDVGNEELLYTTSINRTGMFATPPDYTTADADGTAADDCPIAPVPIQ
jgi:hypothetical protein